MTRVLALGDTHFPWASQKALNIAYGVAKERRPDYIVQMGDLYDQFSFNRFGRQVEIPVRKEMDSARARAEGMWEALRKAAPKATLIQLKGNHDDRARRRIMESFPEAAIFFDDRKIYTFDGVETIHDPREELIINNIIYMHGYKSRLGSHMLFNQRSTVCGHSHKAGLFLYPIRGEVLFEFNVGWMGDRMAAPFGYMPQKRMTQWTLGVGEIDGTSATFHPVREGKK